MGSGNNDLLTLDFAFRHAQTPQILGRRSNPQISSLISHPQLTLLHTDSDERVFSRDSWSKLQTRIKQ